MTRRSPRPGPPPARTSSGATPTWRATGARVVDVCLDLLAREGAEGRDYEVLSVLYATAPLRTARDVQAVVDAVVEGGYTSALAVTPYPYPVHQALQPAAGRRGLTPAFPDLIRKRATEAPAFRVDNGSTYAVRAAAFQAAPGWYAEPLYGHEMPRERSVDIDEPIDLDLARLYFKQMQEGAA
jgi:CMP-N,N'-diacetyllegionaminic acid synthase